jgi:hypothetical protein
MIRKDSGMPVDLQPMSGTVKIDLDYCNKINLSTYQKRILIIRSLRLTNKTEQVLEGVVCVISAAPAMFCAKKVFIDQIPAGTEYVVQQVDIAADYAFITQLSDKVVGQVTVSVYQGDLLLAESVYPMDAYAADQWLGSSLYPELLCSFVTPNLEVISGLMGEVAVELERLTTSSAINGYQSLDKKRAYAICTAAYRAVLNWQINYANPPASFEGQRIRFADAIYKFRLGTCLDTTLLLASVVEQCGLHPVIMLTKGHAYLGCHLKDFYFPEPVLPDLQTIRKLVELDDFVVFETTCATKGASFEIAEAEARTSRLNDDAAFVFALDVMCARKCGILPLPLKRSTDGIEFNPPETLKRNTGKETIRELETAIEVESRSVAGNRITRWRQKLLDLSMRNRLLNAKENNKQFVRLLCHDIATLEDNLASRQSFQLLPFGSRVHSDEQDLRNMSLLRNLRINDDMKARIESEMKQGRLLSPLPEEVLKARLKELYRQGIADIEEGGVNTLFLAAGFLSHPNPNQPIPCIAPIILIPVRLERPSGKQSVTLSRMDDEAIINVTLLELLRKEHKVDILGVDPLPTDDMGVDVKKVMQIFRQALCDVKGCEVLEEIALGRFSFNKFIMWNDLTVREETLKNNEIVRHLVSGEAMFDDGVKVFDPKAVDSNLLYSNLFCPVSADSSQVAAVIYSGMDKSFVLHGPPGTGKSQTITNIIAHNLARGKKVLFVSEKKAALDVVYRRLSQIGLQPFCLELHSNKTGKADVLKQFSEVLELPEIGVPQGWDATVIELTKLRQSLLLYTTDLHHVYPNKLSAYDCFARVMSCVQGEWIAGWFSCDLLSETAEQYEERKAFAADLGQAYRYVPKAAQQAFSGLATFEWNPQVERDFKLSVEGLLDWESALAKVFQSHAITLGLLSEETGLKRVYDVAALFEMLKDSEAIPSDFISQDFSSNRVELERAIDNVIQFEKTRDELAPYNLDALAAVDWDSVLSRITKNGQDSFLVRFIKNWQLVRELKHIKKLGAEKLSITELKAKAVICKAYVGYGKQFKEDVSFLQHRMGGIWKGAGTDWKQVKSIFDRSSRFFDALAACCGNNLSQLASSCEKLAFLLPRCQELYGPGRPEREKLNQFLSAFNQFSEAFESFNNRYGCKAAITDEQTLDRVALRMGQLLIHLNSLRHFCIWQGHKETALNSGMGQVIQKLQTIDGFTQKLPELFDFAYCQKMLDQILSSSQTLSQFVGETRDKQIKRFAEVDHLYAECTKKMILSHLSQRLPRRLNGNIPNTSELGILKRECAKRARHMPVRKLLSQIPTLAKTLKPCFLMSPLSVAQYLPPDMEGFDLIVFDEASQIPVWDAIGVIARGKQLVVVGDPKQMPPTNFFQKGDTEDEAGQGDEELMEDLESILDECIAADIHPVYLNWHYRSRHESLITFSNKHYYDNRLFTFPSASNKPHLGVKLVHVKDGYYDRVSTRTNRREAEAIVSNILGRARDSVLCKKSVGIVTFSIAQRQLIEELLDEARDKYPEVDTFMEEGSKLEPLFVKNLENVQGDERDVILFSICYGADSQGKFYMNFGPLNREGGERRLNVAITRAKEQVIVFSSILGKDIDLNRTMAIGAQHLKEFIEYAESTTTVQIGSTVAGAQEDLFVTSVVQFLEHEGYQVRRNVGNSECRIAAAIVHPDNPSAYLLGIECDGVGYMSPLTARDRDILRHAVLQGLNWTIYRMWIADWWHDRERASQRLLAVVKDAEKGLMTIPSAPVLKETDQHTLEAFRPQPIAARTSLAQEYKVWYKKRNQPQDFFYEPKAVPVIKQQLREIIETEAPICESLLRKRLLQHWEFARTGERIQAVVSKCLPTDLTVTNLCDENVYWSSRISEKTNVTYRNISNDEEKRDIYEIPPEELANAMHEIVSELHSCPEDALFSETIKVFGFKMVTENVRNRLQIAMSWLRQCGRI